MADYITIKDLAAELGIDSSNCRKFVRGMGLEMIRVRPPGTRGTPMVALSPEDAEKVRLERIARGFVVRERDVQPVLKNDGPGAFYIVVLDPEVRPNRLKFGYAQNAVGRLAEHRCARTWGNFTWGVARQTELGTVHHGGFIRWRHPGRLRGF